ncbi:hypothetical protein L5515_018065 [Caenorhabditis briggsae]|uniref:Uncharacterized protein n=1 Tax=Caenorhabditis briggsae TaxID=6238 RepID=A0AAE8ZQT1_CAEBR|nr:hypothetical protein L3Y34_012206 [Caenorhabditis briggsae]UMM42101.1 hypothetical protein L5515_018065 [Caenorhabditis briggsae]
MISRASVLAVCLLATAVLAADQHTGRQNYRVKGVFRCGTESAKGVQVKLIDDDFGPDPDDDLGNGFTDANGAFELSGHTSELTTIDPHLKVYHDCDDGINPCQRRWKFELPNNYIFSDSDAPKTLDIGIWNLEGVLPGESRDCDH